MPEPKTDITDADLELLLAEADRDDPILRAPREDAERAARVARLADPRRARLARRRLSAGARRRAARAVAAASPTRSSPQKTPRPTAQRGSRSAPAPSRRRAAASIAPSRRSSRAARRQSSSGRPGGGRRLGEDLEVVEVEAAREREPRRGEHERARRGPAAPRSARRASPPAPASASAPATRAAAAARRRAPRPASTISSTSRVVGRQRRGSAACATHAGVHVTASNARSTRSAARYVNGRGEVEEELRPHRVSARGSAPAGAALGGPPAVMTSPIPYILVSCRSPDARAVAPVAAIQRAKARELALVITSVSSAADVDTSNLPPLEPGILRAPPGRTREASHTTRSTAQTSSLRPVVARRARARSRRRQVDAADHP